MQENDLLAPGAGARGFIQQADSRLTTMGHGCSDILHCDRDMVEARASLGDMGGDAARLTKGCEQFQVSLSTGPIQLEKGHLDVFLGDLLDSFQLEPQKIPVKSDALFQIGHGNADVINVPHQTLR